MLSIKLENNQLFIDDRLWADMDKTLILYDDLTGFSGHPGNQQEVVVNEKITPVDGALLWEVTAALPENSPPRSISLEKLIPVPVDIDFPDLHCWNCSILSGVNRFDKVVDDGIRFTTTWCSEYDGGTEGINHVDPTFVPLLFIIEACRQIDGILILHQTCFLHK